MESFFDIPVGSSSEEVTKTVGKPYRVIKKGDGEVEYEYVERFKVGNLTMEERHYFLLVKNGKVISKRYTQESPPPFERDSYDLQTSSMDEDDSGEE